MCDAQEFHRATLNRGAASLTRKDWLLQVLLSLVVIDGQ